jgi:hypothetical protein
MVIAPEATRRELGDSTPQGGRDTFERCLTGHDSVSTSLSQSQDGAGLPGCMIPTSGSGAAGARRVEKGMAWSVWGVAARGEV